MIFKVNNFFHDNFCRTIKLLCVLNIHVLSAVVMIISSLHTAKQIICQSENIDVRTSMRWHLIENLFLYVRERREAVSSHNNEKREIFEKFYTRSDKAINIDNLFLRASSVVYHNLATQKALGSKLRHWNFWQNIDSQTVP